MEGRYGEERKADKESRNKGKQEWEWNGKKSRGRYREEDGDLAASGPIDRAGEAGH